MDYLAHYDKLMKRAQGRVLPGYSEGHHVLPKCLGGSNEKSNIVRLTPEEHYVAHQLLVMMHPGHRGILWAASNMTGASAKMARRNKLYGWLRRLLSEDMRVRATGRKMPPEAVEKMRQAKIGTKHTAEAKAKMSISQSKASKGKPKSDAHRAALSAAKMGKKRKPFSPEHRARIAESNRVTHLARDNSKYRTDDYRARQSAKMREVWASRREA